MPLKLVYSADQPIAAIRRDEDAYFNPYGLLFHAGLVAGIAMWACIGVWAWPHVKGIL